MKPPNHWQLLTGLGSSLAIGWRLLSLPSHWCRTQQDTWISSDDWAEREVHKRKPESLVSSISEGAAPSPFFCPAHSPSARTRVTTRKWGLRGPKAACHGNLTSAFFLCPIVPCVCESLGQIKGGKRRERLLRSSTELSVRPWKRDC